MNIVITKPLYSDQILSVPWPFVKSRFHCTWGLISLQCYPGRGQWNFHANSMGMLKITKKPKCMRTHKPTMLPRWRTCTFHANSMGMLKITKRPKCMRSHKPTMLTKWRAVLIKSLKEASLKQAANSRNQLRVLSICQVWLARTLPS